MDNFYMFECEVVSGDYRQQCALGYVSIAGHLDRKAARAMRMHLHFHLHRLHGGYELTVSHLGAVLEFPAL